MSNGHAKKILVPLYNTSRGLQQRLPIRIPPYAFVENVQGLLKLDQFELWKDYVAKRDLDVFGSMRIALVRKYEGTNLSTDEEDKAAQDHLYKLFMCLRLVKPTRTRFAAVHVRVSAEKDIEVFSFTHPSSQPVNVPNSERLNLLTEQDLNHTANLSERFLDFVDHGPANLRRAVRFYEEAYSNVWDPVLQLVTWVIGIEAACLNEERVAPPADLLEKISRLISPDQDIYGNSPMKQEPLGYSTVPVFRVGDAIRDLFELRNRFIHGLWIPPDWAERMMYQSVGAPPVFYADALRDAAAYILRQLILRQVER